MFTMDKNDPWENGGKRRMEKIPIRPPEVLEEEE
jgi:hypothetical protein